jgi:hypothetical protein
MLSILNFPLNKQYLLLLMLIISSKTTITTSRYFQTCTYKLQLHYSTQNKALHYLIDKTTKKTTKNTHCVISSNVSLSDCQQRSLSESQSFKQNNGMLGSIAHTNTILFQISDHSKTFQTITEFLILFRRQSQEKSNNSMTPTARPMGRRR